MNLILSSTQFMYVDVILQCIYGFNKQSDCTSMWFHKTNSMLAAHQCTSNCKCQRVVAQEETSRNNCKLLAFILCSPWMSVLNFVPIHLIDLRCFTGKVKLWSAGGLMRDRGVTRIIRIQPLGSINISTKWWTDQLIDHSAILASMANICIIVLLNHM